MILIFGGTTEGKLAAKVCDSASKDFYYSTKTVIQDFDSANGKFVNGAMEAEEIAAFCKTNNIGLIINAAHPFALILHQNIAKASQKLQIPVIRLERVYNTDYQYNNIKCFEDFETLLSFLELNPHKRILSLAGVNTIAKLKPYWQKHSTFFRIMEKKESIEEVQKHKFPFSQIVYYEKDSDDIQLFRKIQPSAIISKESGNTGGFDKKIAAAQSLQIPVYVIKRPQLSADFIIVTGEYGLRKQIENRLPGFFELRTGYTTGSCATAACKAAFISLLTGEINKVIMFSLPNGELMKMDITKTKIDENNTSCTVVKDSGDDPDVTNHAEIVANVAFNCKHSDIKFIGGIGVGTVTLPGLGLEIGEPAINITPRRMMLEEIKKVKRHYSQEWSMYKSMGLDITISVPEGEKLAKSTFNPRIGIEGGISIIGTSGIVKPFSSDAFIGSIRKEMQVAKAVNSYRIVLNSGAKSEQFIKAQYPDLTPQAFIHYGNFIGESIKIATEINVENLTIGLMIGKAVKLAEGHLNTHSKKVVMNKEFIANIANEAGCNDEVIKAISNINLARQLWDIVDNQIFFQLLTDSCYLHCKPLFPNGNLELILLDNNGERIFRKSS